MNPTNQSAADAYLAASVENAPPVKIVRMLYQGALRFLGQAEMEDPRDPSSKFIEHCNSADAIVTELRMALDMDQGEEVVESLTQLYLFCESSLQTAMLDRTHAPIPGVKSVLHKLLEAWQHLEVQVTGARAA